jgi:hypothetical protein
LQLGSTKCVRLNRLSGTSGRGASTSDHVERDDERFMTGRARGGAPLVILIVAVAGLLAVASLHVFAVRADAPVGVIFAAGMSDEASFLAIVAAGGRPIRVGRSLLMERKVWVAQGEEADLSQRVLAYGARLVVNPYAFGGCLIRYR